MMEIYALLVRAGEWVTEPASRWGVTATDVRRSIGDARRNDLHPVLVEVAVRSPADQALAEGCTDIDHHGPRASVTRPTSIEQVIARLQLPANSPLLPSDLSLIVANDRGALNALERLPGITREQMRSIRERDRRAQGVTPAQETEGRSAADTAIQRGSGVTIATLHTHNRTATITDVMHAALGGPGFDTLLVVSPDEANVFARGDVIMRLRAWYRDMAVQWDGGELPLRGFWGCSPCPPDIADRVAQLAG
jgi:hypothetical protein